MGDIQSIDVSLKEHRITNVTRSKGWVETTSSVQLYSDSDRLYALIVNDSDTIVYLNLGAAAVVGEGIRLNANGGAFEINWTNLYTGAVYGIHGGTGTKYVTVIEGTS